MGYISWRSCCVYIFGWFLPPLLTGERCAAATWVIGMIERNQFDADSVEHAMVVYALHLPNLDAVFDVNGASLVGER